jgi:SMI1 / KNR4 family (SUKH-1)
VTVLDRFATKLRALRAWVRESRPPPYGIGHGFSTAKPMSETSVRRIEGEYEVSLPPEYRAFLRRFGDGRVGPGNLFRKVREGLTAASRRPFPLTEPFLGCCSPAHQRLSKGAQWEEFKRLLKPWEQVPKDGGVLSICDYGCAIYGALILNGPFRGRVWILSGDAAYYGPFGGSEGLHDEGAPSEWERMETPRDYSFFEWYESWLDGQMKMAGLADH